MQVQVKCEDLQVGMQVAEWDNQTIRDIYDYVEDDGVFYFHTESGYYELAPTDTVSVEETAIQR